MYTRIGSIYMVDFNLTRRMSNARYLQDLKKKEGERIGTLRAGNSGVMSSSGQIAGECARITHLRSLGIDSKDGPISFSTSILFDRGYNNEDIITEDLAVTLEPGEVILREKQVGTSWTTTNGVKVTGSPDFVVSLSANQYTPGAMLITKDVQGTELAANLHFYAVPQYGIEAKSIASFWTSRDLLIDRQPKLPHIAQAAHYMWQMGIPWKLIYRQYALQIVPDWFKTRLPQPGEKFSEFIEYSDKPLKGSNSKLDIKNVKPFEIVYDLEFDESKGGRVRYREENTEVWTPTIISKSDVERYYEFTSTLGTTENLGPRPETVDLSGSPKNYSNCGYCDLESTCNSTEKAGYTAWLAEIKRKRGIST